jgi:hypothetical protein
MASADKPISLDKIKGSEEDLQIVIDQAPHLYKAKLLPFLLFENKGYSDQAGWKARFENLPTIQPTTINKSVDCLWQNSKESAHALF